MKKNHKNKKGFALLFIIVLVITFSFLSVYILEIKTFQTNIQTKSYLQIQAKFHLDFAQDYIQSLPLDKKDEECVNELIIDNEDFEIKAYFSYITKHANCKNTLSSDFQETNSSKGAVIVDLFVKSKLNSYKINLHKRFLKKL